jgi:hypothetical protein
MVSLLPISSVLPSDSPFKIGLFGIQYNTLDSPKQSQISALHKLLTQSEEAAGHVDVNLLPQRLGGTTPSCNTVVFTAYWYSAATYASWWDSAPVKTF